MIRRIYIIIIGLVSVSFLYAQETYLYNIDSEIKTNITNDTLCVELKNAYYDSKNIYISKYPCGVSFLSEKTFSVGIGFDYPCIAERGLNPLKIAPRESMKFYYSLENRPLIEKIEIIVGYLSCKENECDDKDLKKHENRALGYRYVQYVIPYYKEHF